MRLVSVFLNAWTRFRTIYRVTSPTDDAASTNSCGGKKIIIYRNITKNGSPIRILPENRPLRGEVASQMPADGQIPRNRPCPKMAKFGPKRIGALAGYSALHNDLQVGDFSETIWSCLYGIYTVVSHGRSLPAFLSRQPSYLIFVECGSQGFILMAS